MKSPRIFSHGGLARRRGGPARRRGGPARRRGGFTLVELLVTIGILAVLFSIAGAIGFNFYMSYQIDSEARLLNALLQQSRNLAMTNNYESDHGVYFDNNEYVLFQGTTFASRDQSKDKTFPRASEIPLVGPNELVFTALSGQTASSTYTLTQGNINRYVYVNAEGLVY